MAKFWEASFREKQTMWGLGAAEAALAAAAVFRQRGFTKVLIPGFGYGRYGLLEAKEITEPATAVPRQPSQRFWQVTCRNPDHESA